MVPPSSFFLPFFSSPSSIPTFIFTPRKTRINKTTTSLSSTTHPNNLQDLWGITPNITTLPTAHYPHEGTSPILEIPNFLSPSECEIIKSWSRCEIDNGADECSDYLNYRVNAEISDDGESEEGKDLIEEFDDVKLSSKNRGGFRIRVDPSLIDEMLKDRILNLLGFGMEDEEDGGFTRDFVYEEGLWIRPSPKTVIVRDQTVVYYGEDNGVPPHVDGKDATLLIYLSSVAEGVGGRTVFPEDDFAQTPKMGTALLYRSKTELLHYSEAMEKGHDKWIMQLLLDFNHEYKVGDMITDYQTGVSYVWDGKQ